MHQAVLAINEERLVGAENAFPVSHLLTKNDPFTKTGSGKNLGKR